MKARLVWLILCGIWGSTWLFIKLGLAVLPPLSFAGIRFVIACAILFTIIFIRRIQLPQSRSQWLLLAITGFMSFSLNYGLLFWGEQYISSGLAALLQATIPAFGLVIAHFYLPAERMTPSRILGVLLGVCGVGTVFSNQLGVAGSKALAGCVGPGSEFSVCGLLKRIDQGPWTKARPGNSAAGQMFFGLIPLLLIGIPVEGNPLQFHWTRMALIALFYLAVVGSVVAFCSITVAT